MEAINSKAYTSNITQVEAIKSFMKALIIKYELSSETKSPYNEAFIIKIKQGDKVLKNGKGRIVSIEEIEILCK